MASDITLSKGVRQNLLSLQNTAELLNRTQERLATGKKVNSALDGPINFFTSQSLSARANDLSRLLDSVSNAVQTIEAADEGITAISKLIENAQAIARQALTSGGPTSEAVFTSGSKTVDYTDSAALIMGSGEEATLTINSVNIEIDDATTVGDLLGAINGIAGVSASVNGDGDLEITSAANIVIAVSGNEDTEFTGYTGIGAGTTNAAPVENATRASLQADFNNLLTQITELASDASFNGVNLLNGDDLTVIFNEDGTSTLEIGGVDFSAAGLGITALTGDEFQNNTGVQAAIGQLDTATSTLRAQATKFGSNLSIVQTRQDFTKNMINVLQVGSDALVLADTNEEGANMLALNTRQQLSTVALSLAAQADQNVLRLF